MKRDQIERLKHNARLDVRMPDRLKDEFLARCKKEGVSSGAVIRSLILDYVTKRPSPWLARYKEMIVRRSRWIAGGIGGAATAGLAALGFVFAPAASADDYEVALDVALHETSDNEIRVNRMASTVMVQVGQPFRVEVPTAPEQAEAEFAVELTAISCELESQVCPDQGLQLEIAIIQLSSGEVISSPSLTVEAGQLATLDMEQDEGRRISVRLSAERVEP